MSTFSQCNGPQTGGTVNTQALLDLIEKYNEVLTALQNKADDSKVGDLSALTTEVSSSIVAALNSVKSSLTALDNRVGQLGNLTTEDASSIVAAINYLVSVTKDISKIIDANGYGHFTDDLNPGFKTLFENPSIVNCLNQLFITASAALPATDAQSTYLTITAAGQTYGKKADVDNLGSTVTELSNAVSTLRTEVSKLQSFVIKGVSFTSSQKFNAPFAGITGGGTDDPNGVFIIGMLADDWDANAPDVNKARAATAYIKFINDYPLDMIINATVTTVGDDNKQAGALTVLYTRKSEGWQNTKVHIVRLTDSSGKIHNYLGISTDNITGTENTNVEFYVAGINFYAPGNTGYVDPNGAAILVSSISLSNNTDTGFAIGNISIELDTLSEQDIEDIWYDYFNKYIYTPFDWSTTTATNPYLLGLYEYDSETDTYSATEDTVRDMDKTYYTRSEAQ